MPGSILSECFFSFFNEEFVKSPQTMQAGSAAHNIIHLRERISTLAHTLHCHRSTIARPHTYNHNNIFAVLAILNVGPKCHQMLAS